MKWIVLKIFLILLTILPLAGCWDTNEPERMVYAHGFGIDYKNGKYIVYLQIINLSLLAKAEVSSGSEVKVEVGKATGNTVDEAIFNLYNSSQRHIFYGHVSFVVFTEEALRHKGIKAMIDFIDRYRETRYRIWIYATKEPLSELLVTLPMLEMSTALSKLSDPKASFDQSSYIRPIDLRKLLISLNEPGHEAILPVMNILKKQWTTDKNLHETIELDGLAVATTDHLKGTLDLSQSSGYRWMSREFNRDEIRVRSKEYSTVDLVVEDKKMKVVPVINGTNVSFIIKVKAKAILYHIEENIKLEKLTKDLEKNMEDQIRRTYLAGLSIDTDIYRLSEVLYRKNVQVWKGNEKYGKVPLSKDSIKSIDVSVKIVNGAKQRQQPTLK